MTSRRLAARWLLPSLVLVLLLAPGVAAQTSPAPASPEEAVREMLAVTQRADWAGYAKLLHPRAGAELKAAFGELVALDPSGNMGKAFFGAGTRAEFDALSEAAVLEGLMKFLASQAPQVMEALEGLDGVILGSVTEGPNLVHVVHRMKAPIEGIEFTKLEVVTVERFGDGWRIVLPPQMAAIPLLIKKGLEERKAAGGEGG